MDWEEPKVVELKGAAEDTFGACFDGSGADMCFGMGMAPG